MFDLRDKDDVAKDIKILNDICVEWEVYHKMVSACILQHNLTIKECKHKDIYEKIKCERCTGTGYIAIKKKG